MAPQLLPCDGCGQLASAEHLNRRFRRLEWTTRFRPIHIQIVYLSAVSPPHEEEFLYAASSQGLQGEGLALLRAVGIEPEGKSREAVLTEFQRRAYFLTHVLECPLESAQPIGLSQLLEKRLPAVITRLKRSLKPKRIAPISSLLGPFVEQLRSSGLEAELLLDEDVPFELTPPVTDRGSSKLRSLL